MIPLKELLVELRDVLDVEVDNLLPLHPEVNLLDSEVGWVVSVSERHLPQAFIRVLAEGVLQSGTRVKNIRPDGLSVVDVPTNHWRIGFIPLVPLLRGNRSHLAPVELLMSKDAISEVPCLPLRDKAIESLGKSARLDVGTEDKRVITIGSVDRFVNDGDVLPPLQRAEDVIGGEELSLVDEIVVTDEKVHRCDSRESFDKLTGKVVWLNTDNLVRIERISEDNDEFRRRPPRGFESFLCELLPFGEELRFEVRITNDERLDSLIIRDLIKDVLGRWFLGHALRLRHCVVLKTMFKAVALYIFQCVFISAVSYPASIVR